MDKKSRLMEATENLFRSRQFHEITVDDVIKEAGVGKGTVYRHFSDKHDLFFQTALAGYEQMCEMINKINLEGLSFRQAMLKVCRTITNFFQKRKPLLRMILSEDEQTKFRGGGLRDRWLQQRKKMTESLSAVICRGKKSGEVRSDIPPAIMAEFLLGMLRTRADELTGADEEWRSDDVIVELFMRGAGKAADSKLTERT
jgi:AcrR family transcriptional regulator